MDVAIAVVAVIAVIAVIAVMAVIAVVAVMQRGCGGTACVVKMDNPDGIEEGADELAV